MICKTKGLPFLVMVTVAGILLNFLGSELAGLMVFPLYFDSICTMAVTAYGGLIPGLVCAAGSNLLLTLFQNASFYFVICHILTVITSYIVFRWYSKRNKNSSYNIDCFLWIGFFVAITNGIIGNIIATRILASISSRPQVDAVTQGIYVVIRNLNAATHLGGIIENLADKLISALISFFFYRLIIR